MLAKNSVSGCSLAFLYFFCQSQAGAAYKKSFIPLRQEVFIQTITAPFILHLQTIKIDNNLLPGDFRKGTIV